MNVSKTSKKRSGKYKRWFKKSDYGFQAQIQKKNEPLQNFRFPDFIQCLPDFSQRFPDFSLTTFFKVRKSERCGSLNPRLVSQVI